MITHVLTNISRKWKLQQLMMAVSELIENFQNFATEQKKVCLIPLKSKCCAQNRKQTFRNKKTIHQYVNVFNLKNI